MGETGAEAARAAHAEATRAGSVAARLWAIRERDLAERAGLPCPVCGRELRATGMCWRSKECMDSALGLLLPYFNPQAFLGPDGTTAADAARAARAIEMNNNAPEVAG